MRTASGQCRVMKVWHQSAPSTIAHTRGASVSPHRCVSPQARRPNVSASASREKYDSSVACGSPPRCTTRPMASVLTSAHSPRTNGTIAPSTLSWCRSVGIRAGGGQVCSRSSTWAVSCATSAAPARSVSRRALTRLTATCVNQASASGTCSKGSQVPKRTRHCCRYGEYGPGRRASSSSRGETPRPTGGADRVLATQAHRLIPLDGPRAGLHAAVLQPLPALRTRGVRLPQVRGRTRQRHVFQHPCPQAIQPLFDRCFNLRERRPRMRRPPLPQPGQHFLTERPPLLLPLGIPRHRPLLSRQGPHYGSLPTPLQILGGHPPSRTSWRGPPAGVTLFAVGARPAG